jgi:hypothetical protein
MQSLTLAYRDDDRLPVIFAIREMARRHYELDVRVVKIKDGDEYEAALFNGAADMIIEHLEYLYEEAIRGGERCRFCARQVKAAGWIWSQRRMCRGSKT